LLILGINEGLNSSIAVCDKGRIVFALQEERISRIKEHSGFPHQAIRFALDHLGIKIGDFQKVALSNRYSPTMTRQDLLDYYDLNAAPTHRLVFSGDLKGAVKRMERRLPRKLAKPLWGKRLVAKNRQVELQMSEHGIDSDRVVRTDHHRNHAASAYYGRRMNPVDAHLVLTLDGGGDDVCSQVYVGERGRLSLLAETDTGHSLGHIYSRVTHLMGMKPHEHEYKLMGMAPYADPDYAERVTGVLRRYLGLDPRNPLLFRRRIQEPTALCEPRLRKDLEGFRFDAIAAGVQQFCEELMLAWVRAAVSKTGISRVVAAGGVFMNVKANKRIAELPEIDFYDVFPSCGDETLPFGGAWEAYVSAFPEHNEDIRFDHLYLGPAPIYDLEAAKSEYADRLKFHSVQDPEQTTAALLVEGKVVARCSGPMEFGARALGNRSLLADPGDYRIVAVINKMIKQRDFWMPFAPAVLQEAADDYLHISEKLPRPAISPFMMHTFNTRDNREAFVAGIHPYDRTARAQIVTETGNPSFHRLIREFSKMSGKSVVLNTSFNLHGHPIVMGARDAMSVMVNSGIDYLMIENLLVTKKV